jgi:Mat/Ecp fimbriae major subunit
MRSTAIKIMGMLVAIAIAVPARAASTNATTGVAIVKPVALTKVRDLDFGTLSFTSFTGNRAVTLSRGGQFTCSANIVCSGVPKTARFNIQGSDKLVGLIRVAVSPLSNGLNTIALTPDAPLFVILIGSGAPGVDFDVGGTITIPPTASDGIYTGTLTVTADYF